MGHSSFLYILLILRLTFLNCDYFKKVSKFFLVHGDEKDLCWISLHTFSFFHLFTAFIDNFAGFCGRESINKNKGILLPTSGTIGHIHTNHSVHNYILTWLSLKGTHCNLKVNVTSTLLSACV